jgi:hypothetical protein
MLPAAYTIRPSDGASVPAVSWVLGITSSLPPAGVLGPSYRSVLCSDPGEGVASPRSRTPSVYHPRSTSIDKRRPFPACLFLCPPSVPGGAVALFPAIAPEPSR